MNTTNNYNRSFKKNLAHILLENACNEKIQIQTNQDLDARLIFLNYSPNLYSKDGSYSVYKFNGVSQINSPYSFDITFVSQYKINIKDILDTNVQLSLRDNDNRNKEKIICGKILRANEITTSDNYFLYCIQLVSPFYYLGLNNRYEVFLEKRVSEIILDILTRYTALLNVKLEIKLHLIKLPIREYTTMHNQSDLEFITMLCEEEGLSLIYDYSNSKEFTITLCELSEHAKKINGNLKTPYTIENNFTSSSTIYDYFDENRPAIEFKNTYGLLPYDFLNKEFHNTNTLTIKGSSRELFVTDCINITLENNLYKTQNVIIVKVMYEGYFPNVLTNYAREIMHKQHYSTYFEAIKCNTTYKSKISGMQKAIVSQNKQHLSLYKKVNPSNEVNKKKYFKVEHNHDDKVCELCKNGLDVKPEQGKGVGLDFDNIIVNCDSSIKNENLKKEEFEGTVNNIRLNNTQRMYISKVINKDIKVIADTTLKEGTKVEVAFLVYNKFDINVGKITEKTVVKDNEIEKDFDHEELLKKNNLPLEEKYYFKGEIKW